MIIGDGKKESEAVGQAEVVVAGNETEKGRCACRGMKTRRLSLFSLDATI